MVRTAGTALLVAGAYYVAGRLGLLLAIPPGYATAVWPPSGIALAAVLLGGMRLAPGVWLGSFLINIGTEFSWQSLGVSLGVPVTIALGATLQAMLGAWLIRRRGYRINLLAAGSDVVPLLLLGGPLACLTSATLGVGGLWLAGRVPFEAVPFSWWTWWIGDSIGVLLFTPLVLIWAVRPYRTWFRRQGYVTAPLVLLFAVVVILFVYISRREQARIETEFRAVAADVHQGLRIRLDNTLNVLSSIEGLFAGVEDVQTEEFERFAERLLSHLNGVSALSWNPIVGDRDRAGFEASARRRGYGSYQITERAEHGGFRPAARRAEYAPIMAVAPRAGNESVVGFDIASEPTRRAAMEQATRTGKPVASGRIRLVQNAMPGLLVMLPVYRRDRGLSGFAVAAFSLDGLLGEPVARARDAGLRFSLLDVGTPGAMTVVYGAALGASDLQQVFEFDFAGQSWRLELGLERHALVARRSWGAWFVLAGGLFLTGLLGVLLLLGVGRTAHIEALVAERTEELRRTATQLARSNRELEQFAYVTSHDLKAPLRTVSSFAQLLVQRYGASLESDGREFLGFISSGVGQMQALIDDLLQLSKVDARRLEMSPLPMREAVDRACGALAADIEACGARLEIGPLPSVHGDLHMLTQLWQNLIANAMKFQPPGQVPCARISAVERPSEWCFSISDNGIGISPDYREQIFLVFRRLHTADEYPGTGIGLAICRKVVQLHGGEIWVADGGPERGCTFSFSLPKVPTGGEGRR